MTSSSPSTKRSLRPSPFSASQQQPSQYTAVPELPSLQPATPTTTARQESPTAMSQPVTANRNKRKSMHPSQPQEQAASSAGSAEAQATSAKASQVAEVDPPASEQKTKKSRTNTPWTAAEELRLKQMRDAGNSWSEIAKTFPQRTEGSVKKHWYKDMHYAEFAEDESAALLAAIKEYDANKWKAIGQKVGKPAKACEQYAKEHFGGKY
ncbi:hypothetical protein P153DRAFT_130438 [Dothidotthia symphoricarpi CBS 119687]|uniref:Uncharacterized protein n=1 Tax=Dothidotthia symphoricarpi CBS 119687 TaxID=1392245 RepID=A0A6A6A072_9PLEO|nr:uncharacterized protein P153DRAFT_130438 [Dothidotthia symphoricarpi CBS 119687]KAF2124357.1 hypothetical protein P153DRAFT_130438 [Dothidotthia symphoricarpi CBS 119687]